MKRIERCLIATLLSLAMLGCGEGEKTSQSVANHICQECGKAMKAFTDQLEAAGSQEKKMELMQLVSEVNQKVENCVLEAYGQKNESFKEEVLVLMKNECNEVYDLVRAIK